ncbi:hypothetical protein ACHAWF_001577 [Thalassiosira exigua]
MIMTSFLPCRTLDKRGDMMMGVHNFEMESKPMAKVDFDASAGSSHTADADDSCRSGCHAAASGRRAAGCLKVQTQRDSLARISSSSGPSVALELDPISEQKQVHFDTVEFREYPRILGDNPYTSSGPPIGIGWRYCPEDTVTVDLDLYESGVEGSRRSKQELAIPADVRVDMLREAGYSRMEINAAVKTAREVKKRRGTALKNQKFDPVLERVETVKCGVKRMIPRRRSSCDRQ